MAKTPLLLGSAYFLIYVFLFSFLLLEIFFLNYHLKFLYVSRTYLKTRSNSWIKMQRILMSHRLLRGPVLPQPGTVGWRAGFERGVSCFHSLLHHVCFYPVAPASESFLESADGT